ncbi:hypothetical protein GCM10027612_74430 [Microbispora bryophytorum subsp. camponoti]
MPESLIVLGGGAVGCELAQVFARFGTRVSVVEAADRLLAQEEPEAGVLLARVFAGEGLETHTGVAAERVRHDEDGFTLTLEDGRTLRAVRLLVATGRTTDLAAIVAGDAGLDENARFVAVDGRMRAADGVWAVGDVTGRGRTRTSPSTRAGSPPATSSARAARRPTTGRCPGSRSPTPRWPRSA